MVVVAGYVTGMSRISVSFCAKNVPHGKPSAILVSSALYLIRGGSGTPHKILFKHIQNLLSAKKANYYQYSL
jgi:hypothetical protein